MACVNRSRMSRVMAVAVASMSLACSDEYPAESSSRTQSLGIQRNAVAMRSDSLDEDPTLLSIAEAVPEFGGMYFDEMGQLVVTLTDVSQLAAAESRIRPLLGTHETAAGVVDGKSVRFVARAVQHTFLELAQRRAALRARVFGTPGVVSLGVKESENRIVIGVAAADAGRHVRDVLAAIGVPDEMARIEEVSRPVVMSHTLASSMGDIHGGWEITNLGVGTCTLGFAARRYVDGSPVFVTNSHCTTVQHGFDGGAMHQAGIHIGNEILDPSGFPCLFNTCRYSDAALFSTLVPI